MNNIENIVNQAKEQLEHEEQAEDTDEIPILHIDEDTAEDDESVNEKAEQIRLDEEAEPEEDSLDVDDDLPALDGYGADEMDEYSMIAWESSSWNAFITCDSNANVPGPKVIGQMMCSIGLPLREWMSRCGFRSLTSWSRNTERMDSISLSS